jgi:hypothetical protein
MTPDDEMRRGHNAARILNDALYKEAWDLLERRLLQLVKMADIDAEKERRAVFMLKVLDPVRRHFESVLQGGEMAAKQIEQDKKTWGERVKEYF